jgi:hypothetical protein
MTRTELLAFQASLLRALSAPGEHGPPGIDPSRLELVGQLAHAKRLAKVEAVLPRTCRALGAALPALTREFALAHTAEDFRSRADAGAFYRFLRRRFRRCRLPVPHLWDLVYCELALSTVSVEQDTGGPDWQRTPGVMAIRRAVGVRLRVCAFNLRDLFRADGAALGSVEERRTHVAIVADPPAGAPGIVQISADMFRFLCSVRRWCGLEQIGDESVTRLLAECERSGLIEIAHRPGSAGAQR